MYEDYLAELISKIDQKDYGIGMLVRSDLAKNVHRIYQVILQL